MASAGRAGRRIFQTRAWSLSRLVIFAALRARISRTRLSPCERCAAGLRLARADARASMAARASAWIGTAAEYIDVSSVGSMSIRMMSPAISSFARKWSPAATSEPTSSTTSASASACLVASCRTEQPSDNGWESGRDRRLISELVDRSPAFPLRWGGRRPGQYEHGLRIAVSLRDAGRRVGDARPANDRADSWLAGRARVAVGHEAGALLVATLHVADPGTRDAAVQLQSHRTGHAEHGIHLVGREQPHHGLPACRGADMFPVHRDD